MAAIHDRKRLDSWKEVATFFGRAERTVKRWEAERGLPIHRVPGSGHSSVFAYADELTEWLKGADQELEPDVASTASGEQFETEDLQVKPGSATERIASLSRNLIASSVATWLLPTLLIASVVVFVGRDGLRFRASANHHIPNVEAQDLYLKGRYFWDRRTPDDLNKAVDYFTQAIVKDPSDAEAYVGLADCYNLLREFGAMPPAEAYPRALSAAQRAVELDEASAEAHDSLAFGTFWWSWQGATAEREFKRAIELNPNLARAHHWYATYLLARHRWPEALDEMEQARKLEPSSNAILADKGLLMWQSGDHAGSLALLKQLETTEPSFSGTHDYLGRIYWERKDYAKALAEWRRMADLRHDKSGLALADVREKGFTEHGLEGLWQSELSLEKDAVDHGSGSAFDLATIYCALGRKQEAETYLQLSFDRHEGAMLIGDPNPFFDNDPEYQKLRAQVDERLAQ